MSVKGMVLRLAPRLKARLERRAKRDRRSQKAIIELALEHYLGRDSRPRTKATVEDGGA